MINGFNTCTEMKEQRKNAKTGPGETPNQIQVSFAESEPPWRIRVTIKAVRFKVMKTEQLSSFIAPAFALMVLLAGGCAVTSEPSSMPDVAGPHRGIADYREITGEAHEAVARAVDALERLEGVPTGGTQAAFDHAFEDLELTSCKARSRAEAIVSRGEKYFEEWREHIGTDHLAQADYNRLFSHFSRVRDLSEEVGAQFRPFMARLREFRASIDTLDPVKAAGAPAAPPKTPDILTLIASGRRVLKSLEAVSAGLDDAEAELKTMLASKR